MEFIKKQYNSWFNNAPQITSKDEVILTLKMQRDRIRQYQKRILIVQQREHNLAKDCVRLGNRQRALLFLRKEQYQKRLISQSDEQLGKLEELVSSIEFAEIQKFVALGLEEGAKILKEINQEMNLERIEKIMDDNAEARAYQEEVEQMLTQRISHTDEEAVEIELNKLEDIINPKLPRAGSNSLNKEIKIDSPQKLESSEEESDMLITV